MAAKPFAEIFAADSVHVLLQIHLEAMRDQVLVAERAVLYTISFQLRIKTPYPDILAFQQHIVEAYKHDIVNIAWSLVNDRWVLLGRKSSSRQCTADAYHSIWPAVG
eukprot:GHRR01021564.1.p2 GENE.GHRR01021564.1~~GHRR01021564.1.p2  ORF type:complete len:107 (+),score=36.33 GHRR01021564.1:1389-1709(+)